MTYSGKEADILIKFYQDKMVGTYLDEYNQLKISKIEKYSVTPDCYEIRVVGERQMGTVVFDSSLQKVADRFNLPSPKAVLKDHSPHE